MIIKNEPISRLMIWLIQNKKLILRGDDMKTLSLNDEQIKQVVVALTIAAQNIFTCGIEHPNPKTADELIKKSEKFDAVLDVIVKQADLPIKFARNQVD